MDTPINGRRRSIYAQREKERISKLIMSVKPVEEPRKRGRPKKGTKYG